MSEYPRGLGHHASGYESELETPPDYHWIPGRRNDKRDRSRCETALLSTPDLCLRRQRHHHIHGRQRHDTRHYEIHTRLIRWLRALKLPIDSRLMALMLHCPADVTRNLDLSQDSLVQLWLYSNRTWCWKQQNWRSFNSITILCSAVYLAFNVIAKKEITLENMIVVQKMQRLYHQ